MGLTPHGVSGLKSSGMFGLKTDYKSHPTRGEWIEIIKASRGGYDEYASHPTRGEWIEISTTPAS